MYESHIWGGTIRKLWPQETAKFRDHLLRLDDQSRRLRFGMPASDAFLEDYAARAATLKMLIYGFFIDGELRGAAEMRPLGDSWDGDAEGAFSVETEYQNRGIGTELFGRLVRAARNRRVRRLYMNCLAENRKMQRIAKKFDAQLHFDHGEVEGRILPPVPTYVSLWGEMVEDTTGFVFGVLDIPFDSLSPASDGLSPRPNERPETNRISMK